MRMAWDRFWFGEGSLVRLGAYRILLLFLALYDVHNYGNAILIDAARSDPGTTWNPILLLQLLHLGPPGPVLVHALWIALLVTLGCGLVGLFTRTSCAVGALLVLLWSALAYSHGKPHHDKVAYSFALLALSLGPVGARLSLDSLLARVRRTRRGGPPFEAPVTAPFALLPIRVAQFAVALGYGFAGLSKLVVAGPGWANGWSLMGILMGHDNVASAFVSTRPWLAQLLSVAALLVQLSFPLGMLWVRGRWLWLVGATGFHLGTWATMDTGSYVTLWYLGWIAFLPLGELPLRIRAFVLRVTPVLRPALLLLPLAPLAFVAWVLLHGLPWPWLLPSWIPVGGFLLFLRGRPELTVVFDGRCGLCRRTVAALAGFDLGQRLDFQDLRDEAVLARRFPRLDPEACVRDMHVVDAGGRATSGFDGYRWISWRLPLLWPLAPFGYLPPLPWLGRRLYRRVADRRELIGCGDASCPVHAEHPAGSNDPTEPFRLR